MRYTLRIAGFIITGFLSGYDLFGQAAETFTDVNCPQEKMAVHLSQESLFSGELLWFKVYCASPLFPKEELSSLAFVELVNIENVPVLRKKIVLNHGTGSGEFEIPENMPTGLYHLLAYTNWMKNFGEESFFRKELVIINPGLPFEHIQNRSDTVKKGTEADFPVNKSLPFSITTDRTVYSTRQQVTINLEPNNNLRGKITTLSVSVDHKEPQMIYGTGRINRAEKATPPREIAYLPDYKGIRLTGRLKDASDNGIANVPVLASAVGKGTDIKQNLTDSKGNFSFLLNSREGEQDIVFTLPIEGSKISLEESFWNGFRNPPAGRSLILDNKSVSYLKGKFIHYQLQSRFKKQNFLRSVPEIIPEDSAVFYSKPYQLIELKNYITLDSLREYFYELVPSVRFGQRKGELDIAVRDSLNKSFYEEKPGVFIDGVLYDDYSQIARLPVRETGRIIILPKVYYYRDFTFGGIIDIHTLKSDFSSVKPLPLMTRIIYPLADPSEWKFVSPTYFVAGNDSRTPDFRYLLYWNPDIQADHETVKLYTGDVKGTFVVRIMGLTEDGAILQAEREIVVE